MYNRRIFLRLGSSAIAGGLLIAGRTKVLGHTSESTGLFKRETFGPLLNTNFAIVGEKFPTINLRLVEIVGDKNRKKLPSQKAVERFSLIFEAPENAVLEDRIYKMSHPELGKVSIFISTVGRSNKRYQAVFSRI